MNVDDIKKLSKQKIKEVLVLSVIKNKIMFDRARTHIIFNMSLNDVYLKKKLQDFENISTNTGIRINTKIFLSKNVVGSINKKDANLNVKYNMIVSINIDHPLKNSLNIIKINQNFFRMN